MCPQAMNLKAYLIRTITSSLFVTHLRQVLVIQIISTSETVQRSGILMIKVVIKLGKLRCSSTLMVSKLRCFTLVSGANVLKSKDS